MALPRPWVTRGHLIMGSRLARTALRMAVTWPQPSWHWPLWYTEEVPQASLANGEARLMGKTSRPTTVVVAGDSEKGSQHVGQGALGSRSIPRPTHSPAFPSTPPFIYSFIYLSAHLSLTMLVYESIVHMQCISFRCTT